MIPPRLSIRKTFDSFHFLILLGQNTQRSEGDSHIFEKRPENQKNQRASDAHLADRRADGRPLPNQ